MKINVQTTDLVSALATVSRALPVRAVNQIMEGILLEADGTTLTLTASDGSITIRTGVPCFTQESGRALLPGKLLTDLAKKLPASETTIEQDGTAAKVRSGKSRSTLAAMSAQDYPEQVTFDGKWHYSMTQGKLRDMLTSVSFCAATDDTRIILNGVLFDVTDGKLSTVSLDGFRLAIVADDTYYQDDISEIIPSRTVNELQRLLSNSDAPCALSFTDGKLAVSFDGDTVTTTLLSGQYPDFHKILPDGFRTNALIHRASLEAALDRASIMSREGHSSLVKLSVTEDGINVSANSQTGNAEEDVQADVNGPALDIAFNAKYLTDVCKAAGSDEMTMSFNTPTSPCVIKPKDQAERLYLVLPVRIA